MRVFFLRCAACFVVLSVFASLPAAAQPAIPGFNPPKIDIPGPRRDNPLPQDVAQIKARLDFLAKFIVNHKGNDAAGLIASRKAIVSTFMQYTNASYGFVVATEVNRIIAPLLAVADKVKQVNVAMALASIPHVALLPTLAKMVVHPCVGVRHIGWGGYPAIWPLANAMAGRERAAILAVVRARCAAEMSPRVLGALWKTAGRLEGADAEVVSSMAATWRKRCVLVFAGDVQMTEAVRQGVVAAMHHGGRAHRALVKDFAAPAKMPAAAKAKLTAVRRQAAQMIVDATYCAAKVYGKALVADTAGEPTGMAAYNLMYEGEMALNDVLGLGAMYAKKLIHGVMSNPKLRKASQARGDALVLAVLDWAGTLNALKAAQGGPFGLKDPPEKAFNPDLGKATTSPATQPATKPATPPKTTS